MPPITRKGQYCAPGRGKHGHSCFTLPELRRIASTWNRTHPESSIPVHRHRSGGELWHDIDNKMKSECNNEICWTESSSLVHANPDLRRDVTKQSFRPVAPISWRTNPTEWLSTLDIHAVMKQYEYANTKFKFIGAVPVDFASPHDSGRMGQCVVQELCSINVKNWLKRGIHRMGIVFNMDAHDEPGSHWTSLYTDFDANIVLYYDSFGDRAPPEVQVLMRTLSKQLETFHDTAATMRINEQRHQFQNTECGIYSMYFIVSMLQYRNAGYENVIDAYTSFMQDGLTDKQMTRYRKVFFRTLYDSTTKEPSRRLVGGGRSRKRTRSHKRLKRKS